MTATLNEKEKLKLKLAIITARGGSKRIPKKNIKNFCGKPIIAYSIEAALACGIFDEVMVSTDSDEIKAIAEFYGASVPFMRSADTSGDFATTADVLLEVVNEYKKIGKEFEIISCIYPTAPFVTSDKLSNALNLMLKNNAGSVTAVVKYDFPPQRAFVIRDGEIKYLYPEHERTRSQDLEPIYHDCGQFYFVKTDLLLKYHSVIVPGAMPYIMPEEEVQDIDTLADWNIAEIKYKIMRDKLDMKG